MEKKKKLLVEDREKAQKDVEFSDELTKFKDFYDSRL